MKLTEQQFGALVIAAHALQRDRENLEVLLEKTNHDADIDFYLREIAKNGRALNVIHHWLREHAWPQEEES